MPLAPNMAAGQGRLRRRRAASRRRDRPAGVGPSTQPTKRQLSPRQRANRNPLFDPLTQLSGNRLRRAAKDLVALEFDPQRRALDREGANAQRQGNALIDRTGDYYRQLAAEEQDRLSRSQAIASNLKSDVTASGAQTQATLSQIGTDAQRMLSEDAASRGTTVGGDARLVEELAAARARAAEQTAGASTAAAGASANQQGLLDLSGRAMQLQGAETQRSLANQLASQMADVQSRRLDLEGQAGSKFTEQLLGLRQSGFENIVTQAGLNLKSADLRAEVQQDRRDARLARQRIRSTERQNRQRLRVQARGQNITARGQDISATTQRRGQDLSAGQRAADRAARERIARLNRRGQGASMDADARKMRNGIINVQADIEHEPRLQRAAREGRWDDIRNLIVGERGAPPIVGQAAIELARRGTVSATTARALRRAGIRVPRGWLPLEQQYPGRRRTSPVQR